MNGHLFSCVLFLNMGINLDLQDLFGATALCYSAASPLHGTVAATHELIGLLIARGSYPKIRDVCGRQALHYAAGKILFFGLIIVSIPLLLLPPSPLT
jgi:hypothetical protein